MEVPQETTYDRAATNHLIQSMGIKFRQEIVRPIGPTPVDLPVNQSFSLAATHLFLTIPDQLRACLARTSAADIAQRSRHLGTTVSPPAIWMLGYHFLVGREIFLDFGVLKDSDHAQDIGFVLDCWRQFATTHRNDGHVDNSEAGWSNHFLSSETIQQLYPALVPIDDEIRRVTAQFLAALESYLFVLNAEARLGIADSGPYPLSTNRVLIVRDFFDLTGRWYPWYEITAEMPYPSCSLAFTLDPADFQTMELSDRAALVTSPRNYTEVIRELVLVNHDHRQLQVLPFTDIDRLTRAAKKIQPRLLSWFQRKSRHDAILFGARPWALRPLGLVTRAQECLDWEPAQAAVSLLSEYTDDDALAARWATHRCLARNRQSAFTPVES